MRKPRLTIALAVFAALAASPFASAQDQVVNVYNWSDYIAEDTLERFTEETGIKVNYSVFDANIILEAKLVTGNSGFDVVVPTSNFLERQIKAGIFRPLEKSKLPNLNNMDADLMAQVAAYDPGNAHATIYMWGTTGIGYNVDKVKERLPDAPVDSFAMTFDPDVASKLADCGIALIDEAPDIYSSALAYLGLDPNSESLDDLDDAQQLLMSVRPYLRYFNSSQYINDLANGEICVAFGYSGDILQARDRAEEAGNDVEVAYSIPKEGAILWFDMLAIPHDAPNPENAHAFINFIMKPDISADISNYVFYANANAASLPLVDEAVKSDPGIYPPAEIREKLFVLEAHSPAYDRQLTRAMTRLKTGR